MDAGRKLNHDKTESIEETINDDKQQEQTLKEGEKDQHTVVTLSYVKKKHLPVSPALLVPSQKNPSLVV